MSRQHSSSLTRRREMHSKMQPTESVNSAYFLIYIKNATRNSSYQLLQIEVLFASFLGVEAHTLAHSPSPSSPHQLQSSQKTMKPKAYIGVAFGSKLLHPCRKLLLIFRLKKKLAIRRARASPRCATSKRASPLKGLIPISFISVVRSLKKKMNARGRLEEGKAKGSKIGKLLSSSAISYSRRERLLFPSPITPAASSADINTPSKSFKRRGWESDDDGSIDEVEDACRSFESYLVRMVVEEGKVRDLMDVEELLYCWKNLKCPVFVDLVSRFYGELCMDLFAATDDDNHVSY